LLVRRLREADSIVTVPVSDGDPEQVLAVLTNSLDLPHERADEVLEAAYESDPAQRIAVLAIVSRLASRLPIADAVRWSARLRQHGIVDSCPLVAIASTVDRPLPERLQAAASGFRLFGDASFVVLGRHLLAGLSMQGIAQMRSAIDPLCPGFVNSCLESASHATSRTADDASQLLEDHVAPAVRIGRRPAATIVILAWNAWDHTKKCLDSLRRSISPDDQVVVVDNGSTDATAEHLPDYPWLEVVTNLVNRGFAAGCNDGASHAHNDIIVFLNNDTIVPAGWLDSLLEPFAEPSVAATGPRSNGVSGMQLLEPVPYSSPLLPEFERFASSWSAWCKGQVVPVPRLVGFCMAVRRDEYLAVGGFDDSYGLGGFEDDDLCRKLLKRGKTLLIANACYVHHDAHSSFIANELDWYALQCANKVLFERKWAPPPEIPADHTHELAVQP
jgi:GT2 family glycosyltransferase